MKFLYHVLSPQERGRVRGRGRRETQEEGDTGILIADSCCCTAETNTVKQLYLN